MHNFRFLIPLLLCAAASAATLTITANPNGEFGPYTATIDGVSTFQVFCLDENLTINIGTQYEGTLIHPTTLPELEVAYLVANYAGPNPDVSIAIWDIMGTLKPGTVVTTGASQLVTVATNAYYTGGISQFVLDSIILVPNDHSVQRMIVDAPEPGTIAFMGIGLIFLSLTGKKYIKRFAVK
jgi:hypothetical protein